MRAKRVFYDACAGSFAFDFLLDFLQYLGERARPRYSLRIVVTKTSHSGPFAGIRFFDEVLPKGTFTIEKRFAVLTEVLLLLAVGHILARREARKLKPNGHIGEDHLHKLKRLGLAELQVALEMRGRMFQPVVHELSADY